MERFNVRTNIDLSISEVKSKWVPAFGSGYFPNRSVGEDDVLEECVEISATSVVQQHLLHTFILLFDRLWNRWCLSAALQEAVSEKWMSVWLKAAESRQGPGCRTTGKGVCFSSVREDLYLVSANPVSSLSCLVTHCWPLTCSVNLKKLILTTWFCRFLGVNKSTPQLRGKTVEYILWEC